MTPQEQQLIQSVFDRLARAGVGAKDPQAEALIHDLAARQPDSLYGLVQAVIMQEVGLNQAQQRINELQQQLAQQQPAQPAGGSFLGGTSPWGGGSVPNAGAPQPRAAWNYAPQPQPLPQQPTYAPAPAYAPQQPVYAQPQSPAGGFLRNAATMAAGVAGGSLIAEGISGLFGGHHGFGGGGFGGAGFGGGGPWGGGGGGVENVTVNNYYGDQGGNDVASYDNGQDPGIQDASYDDSSFDSGSDFDTGTDV
jgi:hypothetical protein